MAKRKPVRTRTSKAPTAQPPASASTHAVSDSGRTTKDSQYLRRIVDAIADLPDHPRHKGVAMQAHHLISATGMKRSGLAEKIKDFGYDINLLDNLVFLPCTLQGACHLGVQPHRGNHTATVDQDNYDDDNEPKDYHDMVADRIKRLQLGLEESCPGFMGGAQQAGARHKVKTHLDSLSKTILTQIQRKPGSAPLTMVYAFFQPGVPIGCAGSDSTTTHLLGRPCPVERNHLQRQGPGQRSEKITYAAATPYALKPGR